MGQSAQFTLYEDDGETTNYLDNIHSTTAFSCETLANKYIFRIGKTENRGFDVPGKRDYVIKLFIPKKPAQLKVDSKILLPQAMTTFLPNAEKLTGKLSWTWDSQSGICYVRIPAHGKESLIEIIQ